MTIVYRPGKQVAGAEQTETSHDDRNVWDVPGANGTLSTLSALTVVSGVSACPFGVMTWNVAVVPG
jgi:hypothetical protein